MKQLMKIKHSDLFPETGKEPKNFGIREAARAVLFDDENKIAILKVTKLRYHKLPGGGIEENESVMDALEREVMEEVGCKVSVKGELGEIVEYRDELDLKQISYCYLARLAGEKGRPEFDEGERSEGFELLWMTLDEAIKTLQNDDTDDYQGKFIKIRDLCFLEEAKKGNLRN